MINLLIKYLGVSGLLGVVAVAVIVPTYFLYSNLNDSQSISEKSSQNNNQKSVKQDKQSEVKSEPNSSSEAETPSSNEDGLKVESKSEPETKVEPSAKISTKTK